MPAGSTTVVSLAGLNAAFLGPYGGSWIPTPCCDRLASAGVVWDGFFAESSSAHAVLRSMWTGRHPAAPQAALGWTLPRRVVQQGRMAVMVTDDEAAAEMASGLGFERVVYVPISLPEEPVEDPSDSHFGTLLAEAMDLLGEPALLWVHSQALLRVWDAPMEMRVALADEEGPLPLNDVRPPRIAIGEAEDPDALLAWASAYAAQVGVVDLCLDALVQALAAEKDAQHRLAIAGVSGMATGEHGSAGPEEGPLRTPRLQLPLLTWGGGIPPIRVASVCGASDLAPTLAGWADAIDPEAEPRWGIDLQSRWSPAAWAAMSDAHSFCVTLDEHGSSLRNDRWHLRREAGEPQLFVRPDDRFDINDVASRLPDVVETLETQLNEMQRMIEEGRSRGEVLSGE